MTQGKQLAKDVATELDQRRLRRRTAWVGVWAALVLAALFYVRCGLGWGLGGSAGNGAGKGASSATEARQPCTVRVTATGITVGGKPMQRNDAVAACKKADGAMVTVTGDARQGDWDDLRAAFEEAGIKIYQRGE